jgi:type IV pilus assembly protein PilA
MKNRQKGFSLIELLIVVAIILIIAAIAIPNLLKARVAANESSAVGTLRTIVTAAVTYESTYQNGFPPTQAAFGGASPGDCQNANLLDSTLATTGGAQKSGYTILYTAGGTALTANTASGCTAGGNPVFAVGATPLVVHQTGNRTFCTDESGAIHVDPTGGTAPTTDTVCEGLGGLQ